MGHGASIDGEFNYYVWCYGTSQMFLWEEAPEGAVVSCLRCLVYGPRGEWETFAGMGDPPVRPEMREGVCVLAVDTETRER